MVDEWFLEHLAKVSSLSCVLIVIYFLIYSVWRISQMPNNPWNWNEWHWPIGGRHAVEIYRKPTEMPFTLSMNESREDAMGECTFTLNYLKEKTPPEVYVMWGPGANYLMRLINLPWPEFHAELMTLQLGPGEWNSLIMNEEDNCDQGAHSGMWRDCANYYILQRLNLQFDVEETGHVADPLLSENYATMKFKLSAPINFDWCLLRNQFRYPVAIFVRASNSGHVEGSYEINGIIQVVHVKNDAFQNASVMLAQYIKMNTGQTHVLQNLYVMDEHRTTDDDSDVEDDNDGANDSDLLSTPPDTPFKDILCSVCQASPVTRVIIPCRHVCVCTQCFEKLENCPICRGHIQYYFKTRQDPGSSTSGQGNQGRVSWWQRIERFNERFSDAIGLIRQY